MRSGAYRSFYLPESATHYLPAREFHVEHMSIRLEVDFTKGVAGECALVVRPVRDGLNQIVLDACAMEIGKVTLDGAPASHQYDGEKLRVDAPGLAAGTHSLRVEYSAIPREGIYFVGPDAEYPGKQAQAWTQSEAQCARFWYPCFDHPSDKCTTETVISVPAGYVVVSNGELVSRTEEKGKVTYHWKEDNPHSTYLTSFVAGKFGEIREESEGVSLHYFFPEARRADVQRYFGETPRMVKLFNEITGVRYPYAKYAQTTVEDFIFGGMENISATTLTTNRFHDAQSDEDFASSYATPLRDAVNLVAHELAHQWFGDLVTCSEWSHAWLNEGFADYMQVLYVEKTRGVDSARWDMALKSKIVVDEDESYYRRPIVEKNYVYPDDMFDATTYEKGAWMLHQLRYLMGDKAFFNGVHEYLTRFAHRNADTHDFRKVMEETSGLALEQFFEQSFFMAGYPEFDVAYSWEKETRTATVSVRQTQKLEQRTPVFVLPCDLVFYTAKGRSKKRVWLRSAEQTFSFELDSEPTIVEFDPEDWLLKKVSFKKSLSLLVNQLEGSQDASSRAEAALGLGSFRSAQAIEALRKAAERDQFWYVNGCALKALGEIGTQGALEALLAAGKPANRRARRMLAGALANFGDERAATFLRELLASDPSPYVRCEAALSLAKAAGQGALPALKEGMKVGSPNETLAEACLAAMGKFDTEEVRRIVKESLRYGVPARVRIGAMKAIKGRGHITDEELPILKGILLKDKEFFVRYYLVDEFVPAVPDRRLLDALLEASKTDRDNRVRRRALEGYHRISSEAEVTDTIARLKDEVEMLKQDKRAVS